MEDFSQNGRTDWYGIPPTIKKPPINRNEKVVKMIPHCPHTRQQVHV